MPVSKEEAKQLLERLIFDKERPQDWVQDVWGMSPTLGETAAKLLDVFDVLITSCSEAELNDVLQTFDTELFDEDSEYS
ncbi:MAG: hypothetical protein F6K48_22285 [Okeania sp. SIO3H1]|nr:MULTISPECIES: hypothetical protein [unclassified Okeania]NEN91482.1 hypothetical protein [Okeania sp. SIO3H1]NET30079.1 hypothetical protein [Okeania sp. SIO1I7]NET46988.1 hypothetical protein [Okeania sp. SIO2B3]